MILERTIFQLDTGPVSPERAQELGSMGYMQWLGALRGDASYLDEAMRAYDKAAPFIGTSPAVAVFCNLLMESAAYPGAPLPLTLPAKCRRGGAQGRRMSL